MGGEMARGGGWDGGAWCALSIFCNRFRLANSFSPTFPSPFAFQYQ